VAFRYGRPTADQVTLLTQDIEISFSAKKTGAMFFELTSAYDTVWYRGLTWKPHSLLPDRHMVCMIIEMVGSRSFTFTTGNGKKKPVMTPQERRPTRIYPDTTSLQNLHL